MIFTEFITAVADMRALQREYFKLSRAGQFSSKALADAKAAEKQIDALIVELRQPARLKFGGEE